MQQADGFDKMVPYEEVVAQHLAQLPVGPMPRDVPCPLCGAAIGVGCQTRTGSGHEARTHAQRWRAVGVMKPSNEDRGREYWDGERRNLESKKARYRTPAWLKKAAETTK